MKQKKLRNLEIGDRVIEKIAFGKKKRIGEVVFVQEGRNRKLELMQLSRHDLSHISNRTKKK